MVGEKIIYYYCYLREKDSINALVGVSNYPRTYLNGVSTTAPPLALLLRKVQKAMSGQLKSNTVYKFFSVGEHLFHSQ